MYTTLTKVVYIFFDYIVERRFVKMLKTSNKKEFLYKLLPLSLFIMIFLIWNYLSESGKVPSYMLPSPKSVIDAFITDREILYEHSLTTLYEAMMGLFFGVTIGFVIAVVMDGIYILKRAFYPFLIVSQTIPTIAIAPILILWFGFETTPKIILVTISTFFPIVVNMLEGFSLADQDAIKLLKSMGASKIQIFRHIKMPGAIDNFFTGLKISVAYSVVGAVIAEWLGGYSGLGVYITRVRKSFKFDRMFAAIILISIISIILILITNRLHAISTPWKRQEKNSAIKN